MRGTHTLYSRKRDAKKTGERKVCHDDKLAEEAEAEAAAAAAAAAIDRRGEEVFCLGSALTESGEKEDFLLEPSSLLRFFAPSYPPHPFPPASSHTEAGASDGGEGEYYAFHRGRLVLIVGHREVENVFTVHSFESHMRSRMQIWTKPFNLWKSRT